MCLNLGEHDILGHLYTTPWCDQADISYPGEVPNVTLHDMTFRI